MSNNIEALKTVSREHLETIQPGLYLLDATCVPGDDTVFDAAVGEFRPARRTGRMLARVRSTPDIPHGEFRGWNRKLDGLAVVLWNEVILKDESVTITGGADAGKEVD